MVNWHTNIVGCVCARSLQVSGSNVENVSPQVIRRVTKEVMELAESPPEGIKVFVNEEDITDIQATIIGPGKKYFLIHKNYIYAL